MRNIILSLAVGWVLAGCSPQDAPEPEQRAAGEPPATAAEQPRTAAEPQAEDAAGGAQAPLEEVRAFADLDRDNDGFLSAEEASEIPALREIFALADGDLDGRLSVAEYSQATVEGVRVSPDAAHGPLFTAVDEDGDGLITPAEADAVPRLAARFEELDADGSGSLEPDEYAAALDAGLVDEEAQIGQNRE